MLLVSLLISVVLAIPVGYFYGSEIARPLWTGGDGANGPFQVFMSDLLCLIVLLLPAAALCALAIRYGGVWERVMSAYLMIVCCVIWLVGIRTLSRLGTISAGRRAVLLLVVLPVVAVGSFGVILAIAITVIVVELRMFSNEPVVASTIVLGPGLLLTLLPAGYGCRRLATWIRAGDTHVVAKVGPETEGLVGVLAIPDDNPYRSPQTH